MMTETTLQIEHEVCLGKAQSAFNIQIRDAAWLRAKEQVCSNIRIDQIRSAPA